jgi:hypothetical protein
VKTDDLIEALVEDRASRASSPRAAILWAVIGGAVAAAILFMAALGYRSDVAQAAETWRFLFKFMFTLTLAASAIVLVLQVFRPEADLVRRLWLLALAPAMLVAAALAELIVMPSSTWMPRLIGTNARFCLTWIPLLAVAPLIAFLAALRKGAPSNAGFAGALAGLGAGAIAATFYASHCIDDSPLFVVIWYPIAFALVSLVGYFAGRHWLRW